MNLGRMPTDLGPLFRVDPLDDEPTRIVIDPVERSRQRLDEAFPHREPWWLRALRWCVR